MSLKSQSLALEALGLGMRGRQANNAISADLFKFNRDNTLENRKFDFLRQAQFPEAIRQYDIGVNQEQQKLYQNELLNRIKAAELPLQLLDRAVGEGDQNRARVANDYLNIYKPNEMTTGTGGQLRLNMPPRPQPYNPPSAYSIPRKRELFSTPGPQRTTIAKKTWYDDFLGGY